MEVHGPKENVGSSSHINPRVSTQQLTIYKFVNSVTSLENGPGIRSL